ncbi:MAG: response regulator [Rhodospirillales bacterium]
MKQYDLSSLVVLVAERNSFLRLTIKSILRTFKVGQIIDAGEIEDAWQSFQNNSPDVVIIDWAPGYEGLRLLSRMRRDAESRNVFVPVIITTSMTEYANVVTARDNGTSDFLAKPYSPKTIYQHLCKLIDSRKSFVKTTDFFGPDRRSKAIETAQRRRASDLCMA